MKRKIAYVGFGFLGGLLTASVQWGEYNLLFIFVGLLIAVVLFLALCKYRIYIAVTAVSFFAGVSYLTLYTHYVYDKIAAYNRHSISFVGDVTDYTYLSADVGRLTVDGKIDNKINTVITFFVPNDDYGYCDRVEVKGTVTKITDNVHFQSENYYRSKGEFLKGSGSVQVTVLERNTKPLVRAIKTYRDYLFNKINYLVGGDEGGFLGAMLCGDKSEISAITRTKLYRSGIGHIFAVSGTHMVIISAFFGALFNLFIKNRKLRFIFMQMIIWSFALFAGFSPSVVRAAVMLTVLLLSDIFLRSGDSMNTLGWCALIMPLSNPYMVRDPSFLLSLSGAISMGVIAPIIIRKVRFTGLAGKAVKSFLVTFIAMFSAMPALLIFFDEISIAAPLANFLLLPVCTIALGLTIIVVATGGVSFVAVPVLKTAGWLIHFVIFCADKISSFSYSYLSLNSVELKIATALICAAVIAFALVAKNLRYYVLSAVAAYGLIISAYNITMISEANIVHFVFIPDKGKYQSVIYENGKCVIADMGAKGCNNKGVWNLMTKRGIKSAESVLILKECYYTAETYSENIYPEPKAFYGDFDSETTLYKINDNVPFEDMQFLRIDKGYATDVNGVSIEMYQNYFNLNGKQYNLINESYPIEVLIKNEDCEIRRLDYGFSEQCRLG